MSDPGDIRHRRVSTNGVELEVLEAGTPGDPVIVLAHGFPECAWSWRHQLRTLGTAGYHVIAPDQRGYGTSSRPDDVAAYGITSLTADLIGLVDDAGADNAVFVGHDWGSIVTWETARLHPERVRAVVGVSVPFTNWPMRPTDMLRAIFGDRFFYMLYFQDVGPAERELGADVRHTMRTILWGASGKMYRGMPTEFPPAEGTGFLDMFRDIPEGLPDWLTADDFEEFVTRYRASGFFGPVSWYRNLDANFDVLHDVPASRVAMPSFFIGGTHDGVIADRPEMVDVMADLLPDYRGKVMIDGAGHWTQQEDPSAFDAALLGFLDSL
jgi:pimeloyl-ACP methyl ester carboxylesterase